MKLIDLWKANQKEKADNIRYWMCGKAFQNNECICNCDVCTWKVKEEKKND